MGNARCSRPRDREGVNKPMSGLPAPEWSRDFALSISALESGKRSYATRIGPVMDPQLDHAGARH